MRPVTLTVAGMRSYRTQRTLDFTDRTLMAILGDTGSGKSSLLEALYGALYGITTWDARGLGALIADGVQTLQIELVFAARGQQYKVARSVSRKNYPPSRHALDGPDGEHLDGETAVNARIVQLIGLTGKEFLGVVILPQGRFGQLLQGTAGDRTPILRGILGLGVLDRVRDAADVQATALQTALDPIVAARARLYPHPQAIAEAAAADSHQQSLTVDRLERAATTVRDLDEAARAVNVTVPPLRTLLDVARAIDLGPIQQNLAAADEAEASVTAQEQGFDEQTSALDKQDAELAAKLGAAAAAGTTAASLATMAAALDHLATTLPVLVEQAAEHDRLQAEIAAAGTALAALGAKARAATELAETHQAALKHLEPAATSAEATARERAEHVTAVAGAISALAPQRDHLTATAASALAAACSQHSATGQLTRAAAKHTAAQDALTALQSANAAAHVAKQHEPGQPCPVCAQTLPPMFTAPDIVGEQDLVRAVDAAHRAVTSASGAERQAERVKDAEVQKLLVVAQGAANAAQLLTQLLGHTADLDVAAATEACAAAAEASAGSVVALPPNANITDAQVIKAATALSTDLAELTGVEAAAALAASPAATPGTDDVDRKRDVAAAALETAQQDLKEVSTSALRLDAEHTAATGALERRRSEHVAATARVAQVAQSLARDITALPALLSGPLVTALNLTSGDPGQALLRAGAVPNAVMELLRTQIRTQQAELDQLTAAREQLNTTLRRLDGQRTALRDVQAATVDRPRAAARRTWERSIDTLTRLNEACAVLTGSWPALTATVPTAGPLPSSTKAVAVADLDGSDAQLTAEVAGQQARLSEATAHAAELLTAATQGLTVAETRMAEVLADAGADSVDGLRERLAQARVELKLSRAQADRATAQVPVAEGMDVGIAALDTQLKVLRAVKDLLNPSAFPQYVVEQRQVALLRIASSLFGKLTRDGYGFGEDFMIVDRRTGQPRPPKTLSGGETFLASLALALALVEVSNRSGGQLDCLFLDEGFGSLDSSILGEALDVLRLQATGGRLVGVISHLHAVAAELDDVLVVTKEIEGSTFRWLDAEERDAYLLDEAAGGLLS